MEKKLSSQETAEALRDARWGEEIYCIYCASDKIIKNGKRQDYVQQYRCKKCDKSFNDRTKTIFAETDMTIKEVLTIIWAVRNDRSISEISRQIGRSWKTVNDFVRKYHQTLANEELITTIKDKAKGKVDYAKFGCGNPLELDGHLQT
ncbi:MAG: transposase-like protein [Candidatus Nanohaloarchaea archaeon]|jgi:transposase-like protein